MVLLNINGMGSFRYSIFIAAFPEECAKRNSLVRRPLIATVKITILKDRGQIRTNVCNSLVLGKPWARA
jgi:hypothetical protein